MRQSEAPDVAFLIINFIAYSTLQSLKLGFETDVDIFSMYNAFICLIDRDGFKKIRGDEPKIYICALLFKYYFIVEFRKLLYLNRLKTNCTN